jgi:acyl-CoA thioesterase
MLFSETMASIRQSGAGWAADVGEDWSQGRATFGGMVTALGNETMRRVVPASLPLRGLNTTFVGPLLAGPILVDVKILRVGKSVTIAQATLISADAVAATVTGIYGLPRESSMRIPLAAVEKARAVDELPDSTLPPGTGPVFLQYFGMRWAEGTRPYAGSPLKRSKAYIRHRDTAALSESHAVALMDVIPSPVLQMMTKPAPASSLIWTLRFLSHDFQFGTDEWWRIDTDVSSTADGYANQSSIITNPAGVPAALSEQLVAVFG